MIPSSEVTLFHEKSKSVYRSLHLVSFHIFKKTLQRPNKSNCLLLRHIYVYIQKAYLSDLICNYQTTGKTKDHMKKKYNQYNPPWNQWKHFEISHMYRGSLFTAHTLIYSSKRWIIFMCITFFVTWGWPKLMICVQFFPSIPVKSSCTPAAYHHWDGSHCDHMR